MNILLIEDSEEDVLRIWAMLKQGYAGPFNIEQAGTLREGAERMAKTNFDVLLLDLNLPDSQGLNTFLAAKRQAPDLAIVVLTGLDDKVLGLRAVQSGAQDYLVKGKTDAEMLERSINYSVERQRSLSDLQKLTLLDELTGLYNRRGFLELASKQLKLARRLGKAMMLFYVDLDDMKWINDAYGHLEGDDALKTITVILRDSFRDCDIIARMGGDEFAVLLLKRTEISLEVLTTRLRDNLDAWNAMHKDKHQLSVSTGLAHYDPGFPVTIEELLEQADQGMYEAKRKKREDQNHGK